MSNQLQELYEQIKSEFPLVQEEATRDAFQKLIIERYKTGTRSYKIVIKDEEENVLIVLEDITDIHNFKSALKLKAGVQEFIKMRKVLKEIVEWAKYMSLVSTVFLICTMMMYLGGK